MTFKDSTTFPERVSEVSTEVVLQLDEIGYFQTQFSQIEEAKKTFYYRLSESLLSKFISGEDIELSEEEYRKVIVSASVEHSLYELEQEGMIYVFDDMVVVSEKGAS